MVKKWVMAKSFFHPETRQPGSVKKFIVCSKSEVNSGAKENVSFLFFGNNSIALIIDKKYFWPHVVISSYFSKFFVSCFLTCRLFKLSLSFPQTVFLISSFNSSIIVWIKIWNQEKKRFFLIKLGLFCSIWSTNLPENRHLEKNKRESCYPELFMKDYSTSILEKGCFITTVQLYSTKPELRF